MSNFHFRIVLRSDYTQLPNENIENPNMQNRTVLYKSSD